MRRFAGTSVGGVALGMMLAGGASGWLIVILGVAIAITAAVTEVPDASR